MADNDNKKIDKLDFITVTVVMVVSYILGKRNLFGDMSTSGDYWSHNWWKYLLGAGVFVAIVWVYGKISTKGAGMMLGLVVGSAFTWVIVTASSDSSDFHWASLINPLLVVVVLLAVMLNVRRHDDMREKIKAWFRNHVGSFSRNNN